MQRRSPNGGKRSRRDLRITSKGFPEEVWALRFPFGSLVFCIKVNRYMFISKNTGSALVHGASKTIVPMPSGTNIDTSQSTTRLHNMPEKVAFQKDVYPQSSLNGRGTYPRSTQSSIPVVMDSEEYTKPVITDDSEEKYYFRPIGSDPRNEKPPIGSQERQTIVEETTAPSPLRLAFEDLGRGVFEAGDKYIASAVKTVNEHVLYQKIRVFHKEFTSKFSKQIKDNSTRVDFMCSTGKIGANCGAGLVCVGCASPLSLMCYCNPKKRKGECIAEYCSRKTAARKVVEFVGERVGDRTNEFMREIGLMELREMGSAEIGKLAEMFSKITIFKLKDHLGNLDAESVGIAARHIAKHIANFMTHAKRAYTPVETVVNSLERRAPSIKSYFTTPKTLKRDDGSSISMDNFLGSIRRESNHSIHDDKVSAEKAIVESAQAYTESIDL